MKLEKEKIRIFDSKNGTFDEYQEERYVFTEWDLKDLLITTYSDGVVKGLTKADEPSLFNYINELFKD